MKEPRVYGSKWNKARLRFLQENPLCVMCHEQGCIVAASVVDHIVAHKLKDALLTGNPSLIKPAQKLFWDSKNWQPLCKMHHDSTKQRMEKSGYVSGCDENGMPIDPKSHWNLSSGI
ncbi:HNH endonuclease [Rouxiella badensis]|uniref:HNH endonuclease n=1 Tax=Rouxiella silvae TaxID=1646373 RepID=A0AA40X393_9GAMM|nr:MULTISPECIES: HNH endonuclease signature motif containing protein [Rouxiella]MBF6637893.1 HNH endonuclease [Rouxiella silvae]MCC3735465.1 HNH endonuclease [Rouxiella badensis]MCC3760762.1 HNH endonuclease [Rouxiella badensis]